ncbi:cytochrome c [Pseudooceanicola sp. MF1-13]|uniref:cytochrome c n=1 Tax=Pseudooceanicola sp. MF1-13 TaxID=3379095 RepID=UPI003891543F
MKKTLAAALMATIGLAGVSVAESHMSEDDLKKAVNARQATMQLYAFNLGILGNMAKGTTDYDADAASAAAGNLVKLSTQNQMAYWAPGTAEGQIEGSKALPAIWEDMAGVGAAATAMTEAAMAMEAAAGTDLASLQGAMGALGGACGGCHKSYRASSN